MAAVLGWYLAICAVGMTIGLIFTWGDDLMEIAFYKRSDPNSFDIFLCAFTMVLLSGITFPMFLADCSE